MISRISVFVFLVFLLTADIVPAETQAEITLRFRSGLLNTLRFVQSRPDLFPATKTKTRLLRSEQKEIIRSTWQSLYDYLLASDSLHVFHLGFTLPQNKDQQLAFLNAYTSFLAEYRFSLEFIQRMENDPGLNVLLNEPVAGLGLPSGGYNRLKFHILNVAHATQFTALHAIYKSLRINDSSPFLPAIEEDANYIMKTGKIRGEILTVKNAIDILNQGGTRALFPIQSGVAEWMGDVKVQRVSQSLITSIQIDAMTAKLQPGDILFERREWYLSNIGLPGYWPHTALFIGTPEKRKEYFRENEVMEWAKTQGQTDGDLDSLLRSKYPEAYSRSLQPDHDHVPQVIEAISEGVSFTSMEHSADADSVAVLRPRLSKREKAIAIFRAFQYAGRPYDFNFDFLTDATLVCTELIYKAYEPGQNYRGLTFPVEDILGRKATPANEIVKQFDDQFGTSLQQFEFVSFLDGNEKLRKAVESDLGHFRRSWRRPKWHILTSK